MKNVTKSEKGCSVYLCNARLYSRSSLVTLSTYNEPIQSRTDCDMSTAAAVNYLGSVSALLTFHHDAISLLLAGFSSVHHCSTHQRQLQQAQ